MKSSINILFLLFFFLALPSSCSIRLMRYNNDVDKLQNKEITNDEFYGRYYKLKRDTYINDCSLVKCEGTYVFEDLDGRFEFYIFLKNGNFIESLKMNDYPNSITMLNNIFWQSCYRVNGKYIEVEYLNVSDWKLYNHIKSGYISGDTIIFTEIKTVQSPLLKPTKISEKFIYDSTLIYHP